MGAKVVVGGTFDQLHQGHRALLRVAAAEAGVDGHLFVGLTTDRLAAVGRGRQVRPWDDRAATLGLTLARLSVPFTVIALDHPFGEGSPHGGAAAGEYDVLVVSAETEPMVATIETLRRSRGLRPLRVVVVPMVMDEGGQPISSSAIAEGRIDTHGTLLRQRPDRVPKGS